MSIPCYYVIALRLDNRTHNAIKLQQSLTEHGCNIKMRVGLHEADENVCATDGLIILQACGNAQTIQKMLDDFNSLDGVTAKMLDLN